MTMLNTLQQFWEDKKIPIFNGIFFKNGSLLPLVFVDGDIEIEGNLKSIPDGNLGISSNGSSSSIGEFGRYFFVDNEYISFGGGSYGGDGYIALIKSDTVEWLIFFDWSSEFGFCQASGGDNLLLYQDTFATGGCLVNREHPKNIKWVALSDSMLK